MDALQTYPLLWLIPLLPLAGFVINGALSLVGSRDGYGPSRGFASLVAVLMPVLSFAVTVAAAFTLSGIEAPAGRGAALVHAGYEWFSLGGVRVGMGLHFDQLTSLMLLFITGIGSLIVLYSAGYMAKDRGLARFMAYLDLFLFSMIMLVLGDNLLVTFLGWEGVGLCSYLLIGFWHRDHANNDAARKAFIVNRIGDLGFLLGAFALLAAMHLAGEQPSLAYRDIAQVFAGNLDLFREMGLVAVATLLLFIGCTGKSAQIPLMVWLPDAMAGPTPVSALIHAATMVTSGVFLVARLGEVFACTPGVLDLITWIALATMLWAAIAACFQWDIKKVLAYSTVSQLGFMFLAVGLGHYDVALFHVFTHAFFKATLFLGAGSIIHELHHEQDIRRMGGLRAIMPLTFASMVFSWLAIIGLPPGAGFFSKDLILEHALHDGGMVVYVLALIAAALTAFYMTRMMVYGMFGKARWDTAKLKVHDPDWRMSLPVFVLGIGSLISGLLWVAIPHLEITFFQQYLAPVLEHPQRAIAQLRLSEAGSVPASDADEHATGIYVLIAISVAVVISMLVLAWRRYRHAPGSDSTAPVHGFGALWTFGPDRVYHACLVKPSVALASALDRFVDRGAIAPVVRSVGGVAAFLGTGYRSFQRGQLRVSLTISMLFLVFILGLVLFDLVAGGVQ